MKNKLNKKFQKVILESTGAVSFSVIEVIQTLWSGYGEILRLKLEGSSHKQVVVKHVQFPTKAKHSRGWSTNLGDRRKRRSYEVEMAWYTHWAGKCTSACRVPHCFAHTTEGTEVLMVLEDMDESGYWVRKQSLDFTGICTVLDWLANFHATFLGATPSADKETLWKVGTYWHLDTRPEELKVMKEGSLKRAAGKIDMALKNAHFQTFVHGDAKLANFCFQKNEEKVCAVDFQYVGQGVGMKDVAYFVGSCLQEQECEAMEGEILNYYFRELTSVLKQNRPEIDCQALEEEWRNLYPVAWADFHRFLKGWSPGHWKINSYSERVSQAVANRFL